MAKSRGILGIKGKDNPSKPKKNHILAIAIDDYNQGHVRLDYPVTECEQLIDLLIDRYEFEERNIISKLYDEKATGDLVFDELYELRDKLDGGDNLILIFSGHGCVDDNDEGYWIPVDGPPLTSPSVVRKYLSLDQVLKNLAKVKAHHIVLIVDSCFSGRFAQATLELPDSYKGDSNKPTENPSRWVITSGRLELVADKSPFAKEMLKALKGNEEKSLSLEKLYTQIRTGMGEEEGQTPHCAPIVEGDFRGGEFIFRLRKNLLNKTTPEAVQTLDTPTLLEGLRQGAQDYLIHLKNSRFAKLQFEKILLPDAEAEHLEVSVQSGEGKTPLRQALEQLWISDQADHTLLCGEGGMGKTVSCVKLWEELLEAGADAPLPIFLPLNEYNAATKLEREGRNYIFQFIAREYLDDALLDEHLIAALKQLLKKRGEYPTAILILDGFNEVTVEKGALMVELDEFRRRAAGVQFMVTSRNDMRDFNWTKGFERLDLSNLTSTQIEGYLQQQKVAVPEKESILALLHNPMMLTLYTGASQLVDQFKGDKRLHFKVPVKAKGELLHNFIEAQLAKYLMDNAANPDREKEFLWQSFLLRHLLPYLAYRMVEEGQFFIPRRKLLNPTFNFKLVIEEAYHYWSNFDFTDLYPIYEGKRSVLGFGLAEKDYDALEGRQRRIRRYLTQKLFLLSEKGDTLAFLHQNFRDYFAAVHVQRSIELVVVQNRNLPPEKRTLPDSLQKAPLELYIRQILGELEGEHTNEIAWNTANNAWQWSKVSFFLENNISKLLEQCRGVFDENQLGYTVWNLLTIWKEQRSELSGADLSRLNFQSFSFNGLRISRPGLPARFSNALLSNANLTPFNHRYPVHSVAYSPDGGSIFTASIDCAKVSDAQTGTCLIMLQEYQGSFTSVAYSPDGERILAGFDKGGVKVWDVKTGTELLSWKCHSERITSVAYSPPDVGCILTGSRDNTAKVWDATGNCLLTLKGHSVNILRLALEQQGDIRGEDYPDWVNSVTYSPDGAHILTGSNDGTAKVWNAQTGACLLTFEGHLEAITSVAYSPDGAHILTGSSDGTAKVWNAQTGACLLTFEGHSGAITSVAYSPDGAHILTGSYSMTKVWDAQTGAYLSFIVYGGLAESVAYSPDGSRILTGSDHAEVWDAQTGDCLLTLESLRPEVKNVAYSPDESRILVNVSNKTIEVRDAQTRICLLNLADAQGTWLRNMAVSPDGAHILTGSYNMTKVWDTQTGACLFTLESGFHEVRSVAYSPDGTQVVTGLISNTVKVWDTKTGTCLLTIGGNDFSHFHLMDYHWQGVNSMAYNPQDGTQIVTGSGEGSVKVWDVQTGTCLMTLQDGLDSIFIASVAYNPDGDRVVTGSSDNIAKVWDPQKGTCLLTLKGHATSLDSGVTSVAYSPDGRRIVTGACDNTAKIWDAQIGTCLITLKGHGLSITSVAYSLDGSSILTGSDDQSIKVWDAETGACLETLHVIPGLFIHGCDFRNLHPDSNLSEELIYYCQQYGAIFSDEDDLQWKQLIEKYFGPVGK